MPIDWANPADPSRANIAVAVHRATGKRLGTLTFNPGGPGGSGLLNLRILLDGGPFGPTAALPQSILEQFDIVAWDPRGVGLSTPTLENCEGTATYGELPQAGPVDWTAVAQAYADSTAKALSDCLAANPNLAPYVGTHYVIRDLEAMRKALKVDQWTYFGVSYGTTVGLAYARQYPERVRALVLDGVATTNQSNLERATAMSWAWLTALRVFAGTFPAGLSAKVNRVVAALDEGPLMIGGDPYPRFATDLFGLDTTINSLWSQRNYPRFQATFTELDQAARERGPVAGSVPARPAGPEPVPFLVSFVLCADRPDRPTVQQVAAIAESTAAAGLTAAGLQAIDRGLWCSGLPQLGVPLDASSSGIPLQNSALVVNAIGDPKTPWLPARMATSMIEGAKLITYTGTQHGLYRKVGSACVDGAVTRYLLTLRLPEADLSCPFSQAAWVKPAL